MDSKHQDSENGNGARRLLAAHGAPDATPKFGSQNVITTAVDRDCRIDVVDQLVPWVIDQWRSQGRSVESITIDSLDISQLTDRVLSKVADLAPATTAIADSKATLETVLAATQGRGTNAVARIREAVAEVVTPVIETLHRAIRALADSPLDELGDLGSDTQNLLRRAKPEPADAAKAIQNAKAQVERTLEVLERTGEFALDDRQTVIGTVQERAREHVRDALASLVRELVIKEILSKWPTLIQAAEALLQLKSELSEHLDAVLREGRRWSQDERELTAEPPCNTTLRLQGTSPEEAIAGILERHRFASRSELVAYILERSVSQLRNILTARGSADIAAEPAARLVAAVPAEEAFAAVRHVLYEELKPEIQTIYGRLKESGIRKVLGTLLQRSRLTSDPGPRGSTRFKLNVYRLVIVSLPEVKRPDDQKVRIAIEQELNAKSVVLTEHDATFDEIVVHRVGGGWPWQVLPSNEHFRKQYVDGAKAGHKPHLVAVLPASPRGEIDPIYRNLPHERS